MRASESLVPAPAGEAARVLDWVLSRRVHEYLDAAGRPVGEGRAANIRAVRTTMETCPYAGSRCRHANPMNVSALRQIVPVWDDILTLLSWLGRRVRARRGGAIASYDDLSLVASAGVFLADFLALRRDRPLFSGEIPVLVSGLYKVCLGFQLATFLAAFRERHAGDRQLPLPDADAFHAFLEAEELLVGEAEVCAGPPAMIRQAYDAMAGGPAVDPDALPADCTRLAVDWQRFDDFTHHACNVWRDLVQFVLEMPRYCPELTDPRLPADVRERLNALLRRRAAELLAEQTGLVVDVARGAEAFCGHLAPGRALAAPGRPQGGLAATVQTWLTARAGGDVRPYAALVREGLQARLAAYEKYEATVLAGLNRDVAGLSGALGAAAPEEELSTAALSQVCGRTLRDWGDPTGQAAGNGVTGGGRG